MKSIEIDLSLEYPNVKFINKCVRVILDGNYFIPSKAYSKGVFADLLHSYCLGWNWFIQAFVYLKIFYCSAITVVSILALDCFRNAFFKRTKLNYFWYSVQLYWKPDLLVFYPLVCSSNVVCTTKHFIVVLFWNIFFVLATLKSLWQRQTLLWVHILNNL